MNIATLVESLRVRGVRLRLDEHGTLLVRGMARLTAREREALRRHRDAVAEFLREPEEKLEKEETTETDAEGARPEGHRAAEPTDDWPVVRGRRARQSDLDSMLAASPDHVALLPRAELLERLRWWLGDGGAVGGAVLDHLLPAPREKRIYTARESLGSDSPTVAEKLTKTRERKPPPRLKTTGR